MNNLPSADDEVGSAHQQQQQQEDQSSLIIDANANTRSHGELRALEPNNTLSSREDRCLEYIRETVQDQKVLMFLNGDVYSTVCAALLKKAIRDDQIIAVHIDNGFLRQNESEIVQENLNKLGLKVQVIRAAHRFSYGSIMIHIDQLNPLKMIPSKQLSFNTDPEEKMKIIDDVFMQVADSVLNSLNLKPEDVLLGQGTLRSDLIDSESNLVSTSAGNVSTIKAHNDSYLVRKLQEEGRVIEPLKDFYKDEVRQLGRELGLAPEFLMRHDFPEPGYASRVLCALEPFLESDFPETQVLLKLIVEYSSMVEEGHALLHRIDYACSDEELSILLDISSKKDLRGILLPIRSLCVQEGKRSYSYVASISSISEPNWTELFFLAKLIPKICHSVNRVCYVFGGLCIKEPINEITSTLLTPQVLDTLRTCDNIVTEILTESGCANQISQMPVVLIPIHFERAFLKGILSCQRSIVLRPFITSDFMMGIPAIPGKHISVDTIKLMCQQIEQVPGINKVLYDLTSSPPGTVEFE